MVRICWMVLPLALLCAGCQSPRAELSGIAAQPPLDYAVLVTGGAFLTGGEGVGDTFDAAARDGEVVPIDEVLDVLQAGLVFQHAKVDPDAVHRRAVLQQLRSPTAEPVLLDYLQQARDQGYDFLVVVEQLQNGGIEKQGINGRWPVTLATWLLLGVGMFIPDHTFESRATLRVTVRDLQTGRIVHDPGLFSGPMDLSLVERSDFLGVLLSILVPPFWVGDDDQRVRAAIGETTLRRLLVQLARDLKSEPVRQRLRNQTSAAFALVGGRRLRVDAAESLSQLRLRPSAGALSSQVAQQFEQELLGSLRREGARFLYEAELPASLASGTVQVLAATITGGVASATLQLEGAR
jgi:hypothetical protein